MKRFTFRRDARRPGAPPRLTRRGALLLGAQTLVAGGLLWRLKSLQIDAAAEYRMMAEENRINIRLIPPARGDITDRKGRPLAVNKQNYRVVMIREQAGDVEAALDELARIVDIPPHQRSRALREIRSKSAFVPVTIAENLDWAAFARINVNAPALAGVAPEVGLTRHYPEKEALAHVIGYVARFSEADQDRDDADDPLFQIPDFHIGKTGVERVKEKTLRGAAGASRIEVNAYGRVIREIDRTEGVPGADLGLTIDLDLQRYALERMGEESAATVLIEIETGDILALASSPGFDPNKFVVGISQQEWSALLENDHRPLANKTVSGQYPPGSTFKMMVALAALEAGVIDPKESVFCNGRYKLGDRYFHCWRRGGHGHVALRDALKFSCDVYFYETARRVGIDRISEMANRFGIGVQPDLPITAVRSGLTPTKAWKLATQGESWQGGDTLNAGIGQGYILASPLQLATMAARIAGDGGQVAPRLIRTINGAPAPVAEAPPLGVSAAHLRLIRDGMFAVSNERSGTAYRNRIAEATMAMAGKTGTSQVRRITTAERARGVTRNEDLPWERRDHALFVAFAPYDRPRYAVSVIVEHGGGGSTVAAPIARDVMLRALYGGEAPLRAYPPEQRDMIQRRREERRPPPDDTVGAPRSRA
ncbi:penicillin-binding protein 2 [Pikeienuella sp. HZG-20]|uniref:penicillin-binding protein 2 n=1 Tax=Paludibacillus litoralis TaxID=3133267 RepID=UPI0030EB3E60